MPQFTPVDHDPFAQDNQVQANSSGNRGDDRRIRGALQGMAPGQVQQSELPAPQMRFDAHGDPINYDPFAPRNGVEDMVRSGGAGLMQGVDSLLGMGGDVRNLAGSVIGKGMGMVDPRLEGAFKDQLSKPNILDLLGPGALIKMAPTSEQVGSARQGVMGSDYVPQTTGGEYARTIGQFAPAALAPGGVGARAANVLVPGLMSEGAGQLTKGKSYENLARVLGGLAGGLGVGAATRGSPVSRMLADDTAGVSDSQIAAARTLMEQSPVRLTGAEAVQQVTGGASGLGTRQRVLEGTPQGRRVIGAALADRPDQVRSAAMAAFDDVAPASQAPAMLGTRAKDAADSAITKVRQAINQRADGNYRALVGQNLSAQIYAPLIENPSYKAALTALRNNPELNNAIRDLPDTDLSVINRVVQQLDTMEASARPSVMNPEGNNLLAAERAGGRGIANDAVKMEDAIGTTSGDWTKARQIVADGRANELDPLRAGPLGKIAETDQIKAQTGALYPMAPAEGAAGETVQALQSLPSDLAAALTRQHLANSFNESTQALQGGANQYGGAKFAATIAGNPEQRTVLNAGIGVAAPQAQARLQTLLQALEATGKRQPQGSMTAYNNEELKRLGEVGFAGETVRAASSIPFATRQLGDMIQDFQKSRNAQSLSEALLANPAEFEKLVMDARKRPSSKNALLLNAVLSAQSAEDR